MTDRTVGIDVNVIADGDIDRQHTGREYHNTFAKLNLLGADNAGMDQVRIGLGLAEHIGYQQAFFSAANSENHRVGMDESSRWSNRTPAETIRTNEVVSETNNLVPNIRSDPRYFCCVPTDSINGYLHLGKCTTTLARALKRRSSANVRSYTER